MVRMSFMERSIGMANLGTMVQCCGSSEDCLHSEISVKEEPLFDVENESHDHHGSRLDSGSLTKHFTKECDAKAEDHFISGISVLEGTMNTATVGTCNCIVMNWAQRHNVIISSEKKTATENEDPGEVQPRKTQCKWILSNAYPKHFGKLLQCPKCPLSFKYGLHGKGAHKLFYHILHSHELFADCSMILVHRQYADLLKDMECSCHGLFNVAYGRRHHKIQVIGRTCHTVFIPQGNDAAIFRHGI